MSLRSELDAVGHVDHHVHSVLRSAPADLSAFRGLFSESPDPRQWPHVATSAAYRRAITLVAARLGCAPTEAAVLERRRATEPGRYAAELIGAAGARVLLVDVAYPPAEGALSLGELADAAGCPAHPILRVEALERDADGRLADAALSRVATARADGYVALKTIQAYRGGLDPAHAPADALEDLQRVLEINDGAAAPLPVQVHTGFGDTDLRLERASPVYVAPLLERFDRTPFALLHCYPFVREAAWLTSVYANAYMDLSLTMFHVARPAQALAQALELAPASKLLYGSDAVRTPELYLVAAVWWRDALAAVLPELFGGADAPAIARMILADNALALYGL